MTVTAGNIQEWRRLALLARETHLQRYEQTALNEAVLALCNALEQAQDVAKERTELSDDASLYWQQRYAACATELANERAIMNMVPKYIRYLSAWRAGDGRFLVFNEWVAQQVEQAATTPSA